MRIPKSYYNLSGADITALKNAGVSAQVLTAMLTHDSALREQEQSSSTVTATAVAPQPTVTRPGAVSAIVNQTPTTTVIPQSEPPPPQVEFIPVSAGPDCLWTPGCWSWNGGPWIWFGGYWGHPTRPGHVWFRGNFYHGRGAESFRGGHRR